MPEKFPPVRDDERDSGQEQDNDVREFMYLAINGDPAIIHAIRLVNEAAESSGDSSEVNKAWFHIDGIHEMIEKVENHDGSEPGDDASDELKEAWRINTLRLMCEESERHGSDPEGRKRVDDAAKAYRILLEEFSDAIEAKSKVTGESLMNTPDRNGQPANPNQPGQGPEQNGGQPASTQGAGHNGQPASTQGAGHNGQPAAQQRTPGYNGQPANPNQPGQGPEQNGGQPASTQGAGHNGQPAAQQRTPGYNGQPANPNQPGQGPEQNGGQPNPEKLPFFEDLDRYARLLALEESKGGNRGIISRIWTSRENRRRAERLSYMRDVEDDLREQVMEHLSEKVNAKRQRGEYNGTDDEIAQQMSDEMFDEQRRIFGMIQRKKNEALEEEAGKWHNRVLAKLGSFIAARGSKKKSNLKAGAVGFAHGAVKGTAVGVISGLFGAVWPISMAAGAVASFAGDAAIRRGVRLDAMQQRRKKRGIKEVAGDDEFSQIKEAAGRIGGLQGQQHVADELFKRTRKAAEEDRDKISREVEQRIKDNGVALALGRLAGGAVGGLGGRWVGQQLHDHTPVGHMADSLRDKIMGDKAEAAAASNSGGGGSGGGGSGGNPGGPPPAPTEADFSGYTDKYPWDWAVDQFGENNAISKLYELADAAAQDGHNIQWHGYGDTQWLSIDGNSDTKTVLEILNNYK